MRDFLMEYVGATPERAKEVLEALSDEALAVRTQCQKCLSAIDVLIRYKKADEGVVAAVGGSEVNQQTSVLAQVLTTGR